MGVAIQTIPLSRIRSKWFADLQREWQPDPEYIDYLVQRLQAGDYVAPLLVVSEDDGYILVNGHHRLFAHQVCNLPHARCIVIAGTFADSEPLRQAEVLLKGFDQRTDYRYQFSGYLDRWAAAAEGEGFVNRFRPTLAFRLHRRLKRLRERLRPQKRSVS